MSKKEAEINVSRPVVTVVGLVVSIVALLLSAVPIINNFAFLLALVSLVLGIVGVVKTKKGKVAGRTMAIIVIVLSVLAGVVVLASQSFYSNAIDDAANEVNKSLDDSTGANTEEILDKSVTVEMGTFVVNEDQYGIVNTELPVKITNKLDEQKSFSVQIEAVDAEGNRVADDTVYANSLNVKQTQSFNAFQYVPSDKVDGLKSATFKILSVSQY
ncbi:DUF4190 domain-containing protein [Candidatus Saccharibacteria bacterium]|nr:DUF4190 domain-containing protein [Candidatus Saccharibacteria bacterium]